MQRCVAFFTQLLGRHPEGWYTGRDSPNTARLVADEGQFLYHSDYYGDDLPFWQLIEKSDGSMHPQLVVPYTLDSNDMRFANGHGFVNGDDFFHYLKDAFDVLYAEGGTRPKMLSVGLHCRLIGRPGRFAGLVKFLDYIQNHERVWVPTRAQIAHHWAQTHPYQGS